MATGSGGTAASEWTIGDLLTRGRVAGTPSIASGATTFLDVDCAGDSELTVDAELVGAANGDLAVTVVPYAGVDNALLLSNSPLPVIRSSGPTFAGGVVDFTGTYDVSGVSRCRIVVKNNNAGAQNLNRLSWRLS
jgi:hypothetical protein